MNIDVGVLMNVRLTRVDRETGEVVGRHESHNTITSIDKLLDLMDGSATDHPNNANATIRILDSGASEVKKIVGCAATYPTTAAAGLVTWRWEDISADTYNPDDIQFLTATAGVKIAEELNVVWPNKPASENWFFEWDITLSSGDGNFDNAGFNGMLQCITGASTQHWDGTEGAANMAIKVYDGTPGTLQFTQAATAATVRTTTSLKWIFVRSTGTATWSRVETHNNAQTNLLYDDDIATEVQGSGDTFTYEFTVTWS